MGLRTEVQAIYLNGLGIKVYRAAAADPQNAWQTIFTITGGLVLLTNLIGVRTVIQAGGASTMQFRHSVGPTILDAGTLAITGHAVGTIYLLDGDFADPILSGVAGVAIETSNKYAGIFGAGIVLGAGTIQVTMTAVAGTGSTRYLCTYIPFDQGASIT